MKTNCISNTGSGNSTAEQSFVRTFDRKRTAIQALRRIRKTRPEAKLFCESRLVTVPFHGITVAMHYFIRA